MRQVVNVPIEIDIEPIIGVREGEKISFRPRELATLLGVSYRFVLDRIHAGDIPAKKLGTEWIISAAAVKHLLDSPSNTD